MRKSYQSLLNVHMPKLILMHALHNTITYWPRHTHLNSRYNFLEQTKNGKNNDSTRFANCTIGVDMLIKSKCFSCLNMVKNYENKTFKAGIL